MKKITPLSPELYSYVIDTSVRDSDILKELREETAKMPMGQMQIAPDQGQFMGMLIKLIGAKKALEVGTFTGYSALSVALALPENGKLVACDVSEEFTSIARKYWQKAGVQNKIDLRIAPALDTLNKMLADGEAETFDFAFIDADKKNYDAYYEAALKLVRKGGLVTIDNTLWYGKVADKNVIDHETIAIRNLNAKIHADSRVEVSLLAVGDGLTLALKK